MTKILLLLLVLFHTSHAKDNFFDSEENFEEEAKIYYDPIEKFNRQTFKILKISNNFVLSPISKTYGFIMPNVLQPHILTFFQNTQQPITAINSILIPHKKTLPQSISQFFTNTFFGFFGFFDIYSQYTKKTPQISLDDITQYYLKKPLPYLVLPMGFGNIFITANWLETTLIYKDFRNNGYEKTITIATVGNIITISHSIQPFIDDTFNRSIDPYSITRDVYYRRQNAKITEIKQENTHTKYQNLIPTFFND